MREGYVKMPTEIAQTPMTDHERSTLLILLSFSDGKGGRSFPSRKVIAGIRQCSVRTVQRSLNALKKRGLLSWKTGQTGRSNLYSFPFIVTPVSPTRVRRGTGGLTHMSHQLNKTNKYKEQSNSMTSEVESIYRGYCYECHLGPDLCEC
jgi:hypothetical protein